MEPMRNLTCKENEKNWTHEHDTAFMQIKESSGKNTFLSQRPPRYKTMKQLHSSHIAINGYQRRGIHFPICNQHSAKQPKETLMCHEAPDRPWEMTAIDTCYIDGKQYLITVECFSNFWETDRLRDTKASTCVRKLKSHFVRL